MKIYVLVQKTSINMGHGEGNWPVETFAGDLSYDRKDHPAFRTYEAADRYRIEKFSMPESINIKEIELL